MKRNYTFRRRCKFCRARLVPAEMSGLNVLWLLLLHRTYKCSHCFDPYVAPLSPFPAHAAAKGSERAAKSDKPEAKKGRRESKKSSRGRSDASAMLRPDLRGLSVMGRFVGGVDQFISNLFLLPFRKIATLQSKWRRRSVERLRDRDRLRPR